MNEWGLIRTSTWPTRTRVYVKSDISTIERRQRKINVTKKLVRCLKKVEVQNAPPSKRIRRCRLCGEDIAPEEEAVFVEIKDDGFVSYEVAQNKIFFPDERFPYSYLHRTLGGYWTTNKIFFHKTCYEYVITAADSP